MEKKKGLLTLFGGRSFLPTALIVLHEKPDVVVAISSQQSHKDLSQLEQAIEKFKKELNFKCTLETPAGVDAFEVEKIQEVCEKAVEERSEMEWIFDITGGTALMSIAAYEAARRLRDELSRPINCWYLNTAQTRVIRLVGKNRDESIFHISVDAYATAYKHTLKPGMFEGIENTSRKGWLLFAQTLGKNPHNITLLKQVMNKIGDRPAIKTPKSYQISGISDQMYSLLEKAQGEGLLTQLERLTASSISFKLSYAQDKFLNGAWLEAYVWDEARNLLGETGQSLFNDCRWNQTFDGDTNNELDVAMTYKAQLIIAECKTGDKGTFAPDTIYKWDSVANSFGGKFVGKLLITSVEPTEVVTEQTYKDFSARAHSKGVVVVTRDQLPNIGNILKKQALDPEYPRI